MTPERLRYRLGELGLTQGGLARLLGIDSRAIRRWMSGKWAIPEGLEGRLDEVTEDDVAEAMHRSVA